MSLMPTLATSLASPVKRSHHSSLSSSLERNKECSDDRSGLQNPRATLSSGRPSAECPGLPASVNALQGELGLVDGLVTTPSTPPEAPLEPVEPFIAMGVRVQPKENIGGATEGEKLPMPQVLAAERQIRDLERLPSDAQITLAKLCSQHWTSQYNALKRSLAAAAVGPTAGTPYAYTMQHAPPIPPPMYPLSAFTPSASRPSTPISLSTTPATPHRLASCPPISAPVRSASPPKRGLYSHVATAQTSLTPSIASFSFNLPSEAAASKAPFTCPQPASAVNGPLVDLMQGEPIVIEQQAESVIIASPTIKVDTGAEPVEVAPFEPPAVDIPGFLPGMALVNGVPVKTSLSHPINISPLIPPELLDYLAANLCVPASYSSTPRAIEDVPFILRPSVATDLLSVTAAYTAGPSTLAVPALDTPPPVLGNFVLSSCPGKKVRMNGEAKQGGRGAICRDVSLDLRRARDQHNVRLVVCCLDDDELAYLGVPWTEYTAALDDLGMNVVRLPMVEGFAPSGADELDAILSRIVQRYTLQGLSILAHCRGGIGRAGLVASAWMLKMGLVAGPRDGEEAAALWEGEESLRIVERVIELVRRRRSVKAIETPHQVHFLLDYVTYLRRHAQIVTAGDLA